MNRCEMMECNNDFNKYNQCYGNGDKIFNDKCYCDEHYDQLKSDHEYEIAIKCERQVPIYKFTNGNEYWSGKYVRSYNKAQCKQIATQKHNNKNYCDHCFYSVLHPKECENTHNCNYICNKSFLAANPTQRRDYVFNNRCNKNVVSREIYCQECLDNGAWAIL